MKNVIKEIQDAKRRIGVLESGGWKVQDSLLSATLSAPSEMTGVQIWAELGSLAPLARNVRMRVESGVNHFEMGLAVDRLVITDSKAESLSDAFEGEALEHAQRAREGDYVAALELPGRWSATINVDLGHPLTDVDPSRAWRVLRRLDVLEGIFSERPWWQIEDLIDDSAGPVTFVVLDQADIEYSTGSFSVLGYERVVDPRELRGVESKRSAVMAAGSPVLPKGIPLPEQILSTPPQLGATRLRTLLETRAGAAAWAWIANSTRIEGDEAWIEFFGYRRTQFRLGGSEPLDEREVQESLNLYRWATAEESPDRILAVRQVVSLHSGPDLPSSAMDVRRAAEPLFVALRSGAVAEVLRSQRGARAMAIETARKSSESAQAAAKSVVERTIASLGAVGGVALAGASKVISANQARSLSYAIAAYLVFLVFWSIFIEGPGVTNPLSALDDDLKQVGDLLSKEERKSISAIQSVTLAKRRAYIARVMAPLAYLAASTGAFLVARAQ